MKKRPTREELARRFEGVPFVDGLDRLELLRLDQLCTGIGVAEGAVLVDERSHGDECFLITHGTAAVVVDGETIATIGPGEFAGEIAMFDHLPRTATVVATTPLRTVVMGRREFHTASTDVPIFGRLVARSMATRLRSADKRLASHAA